MMRIFQQYFSCISSAFLPACVAVFPLCASAADLPEAAFPDDPDTSGVNEGVLTFLAVPPPEPVHWHYNRITLTDKSLHDGWAELYQCHRRLDPVPATQIVFNRGRIRRLTVEHATGIGRVRVEGPSVQLEDVQRGAEICLSAQSRVVEPRPGGTFQVRNGPFMRRFLDGFYPLHVRLEIHLPDSDWRLVESRPAPQPGFNVDMDAGALSVDTWFEGELRTEFRFAPADRYEPDRK